MISSMHVGCLKMPDLLICTDLDRTLIPNGPQPESVNARRHFTTLVSRPEITLTYVSGRDRKLVEKAIKYYQLPIPDYVIGDVGTSIYQIQDNGDWSRIVEWENKIGRDWGGNNYIFLQNQLDDITALRAQEFHRQNQYKLSYYFVLGEDTGKLASKIEKRLIAAGIKARLVWSIDEPAGVGLLDILPQSASKLHAIEELMDTKGFDYSNTIFCGDSGNDLEVLVSPIKAVLVGNSQGELQQQVSELTHKNGQEEQLFIARGQFAGMNGNYSAGMLEGIAHYYPETVEWMGLDQPAEEN